MIEALIIFAIFILIGYIAFKIIKKAVKALIFTVIIFVILSFVTVFMVANDFSKFGQEIGEKGAVYLYEDKVGFFFEEGEVMPIDKSDLGKNYSDLLDSRSRVFIFTKEALEEIPFDEIETEKIATKEEGLEMIESQDYEEAVIAFNEFTQILDEKGYFIEQLKKGNIKVYPEGIGFKLIRFVPDSIIKYMTRE